MVTKKQFLAQVQKVYSASSKLSAETTTLGKMASEVLDGDYCCDLCEGDEIEFRPKSDYDIYDDGLDQFHNTTRLIEDVLEKLG